MGEGRIDRREIAVGSRMIFSFEYAKYCLVQRDRGWRRMCVETPDVCLFTLLFLLFVVSSFASLPPSPWEEKQQ